MNDETLNCKVIVGLGNPGLKYAKTRHNIGYLVVKALAKKWDCHFANETRFSGLKAKKMVGETVVHLLLPTTYMNLSGIAIQQLLNFYKLSPQHIVVVTDDVALEYGELRIRERGSSGGHNGLKSVEATLGTQDYVRVRMGVGERPHLPEGECSLADHVLGQFTSDETASLEEFINKGVQVLERLIREPIARVMNAINKKQTGKVGEEKHES